MNTHRAVARFLAKEEKKTELKSEKVELGAIQDLDKLNSKMEKSINAFKKAIEDTKKATKKAEDAMQKVLDNAEDDWDKQDKIFKTYDQFDDDYKKLTNEISRMAKDLGLDVKNVKQLQTAQKLYPQIDKLASKLDSEMSDLLRYASN